MQTGEKDKIITIQNFTVTELPSGQETKSWTDEIDLFANVNYKEGAEGFEAKQKVATDMVVFTVYKVSEITAQKRVKFEDKFYEIMNVTPTPDGFDYEIQAKTKDNW